MDKKRDEFTGALRDMLLAYRKHLFLQMADDGGMSLGVTKRKASAAFHSSAVKVCGLFLRELKGQ